MTVAVSRQAGFTLVELLVVLTIAGLIAAVAVPVFGRAVPHYRAESAARGLMGDLRSARDQAVATGHMEAVSFTPDQSAYATGGRTRRLGVAMAVSIGETDLPPGAQAILHFYTDGSCDPIRIALGDGERPTVIRTDWLTGRASVDED